MFTNPNLMANRCRVIECNKQIHLPEDAIISAQEERDRVYVGKGR